MKLNMGDVPEKKKLSDDEKTMLIAFYKENPELWDSNNPYHKNKERKQLLKMNLTKLFNEEYSVDMLEKSFHSLRSSMLRGEKERRV